MDPKNGTRIPTQTEFCLLFFFFDIRIWEAVPQTLTRFLIPDYIIKNTTWHGDIKYDKKIVEKSQRVTLTQWPLKEERPLNKSITFINFVKMIWSKTPQCPLHIILLGSHPFDCGLMAKLWGFDFCWISLQIPIPGNFHFFLPWLCWQNYKLKIT